jgi:hypothetical protein
MVRDMSSHLDPPPFPPTQHVAALPLNRTQARHHNIHAGSPFSADLADLARERYQQLNLNPIVLS